MTTQTGGQFAMSQAWSTLFFIHYFILPSTLSRSYYFYFCSNRWRSWGLVLPQTRGMIHSRNGILTKVYLFKSYWDAMRGQVFTCWLTPNLWDSQGWTGQNQKPGTPSGSPAKITGIQALAPSSTTFPDSSAGSWTGSRAAHTWTGIWHIGIASGCLMHCTTAPAPQVHLLFFVPSM